MLLDELGYKNEKINQNTPKMELTEGLGTPPPFFLMYRILLNFLIEDV